MLGDRPHHVSQFPPHDHAVLLVEDDSDVRDALAAVLEEFGFVVCEAIDGQEALDQLAAGYRPCAILLDLMMPRMDGWEFRRRQRGNPELSSYGRAHERGRQSPPS